MIYDSIESLPIQNSLQFYLDTFYAGNSMSLWSFLYTSQHFKKHTVETIQLCYTVFSIEIESHLLSDRPHEAESQLL